MSFAPRFSPDGASVIVSLQEGSNANLFIIDLRSKATTRLTDTPAIDTSPSYAPDGWQVCFESRPRRPSADLRHAGGRRRGAAHQLRRRPIRRRCRRRAATTSPSPNSRRTRLRWGDDTDGSGERILTKGFHNEGPTFARDGRVIMYFSDAVGSPGPSLFTIDTAGRNQRRVPTPSFASDPAWSPLLSDPRRAITRLPH